MALRAFYLVAVGALLFCGAAHAESDSLPSRKASVVVPMLRKYSPGENVRDRKSVLPEIQAILGNPSAVTAPSKGIEGTYIFYDYVLDDKTKIEVLFVNDGLISVNLIKPDRTSVLLYRG